MSVTWEGGGVSWWVVKFWVEWVVDEGVCEFERRGNDVSFTTGAADHDMLALLA